MFSMQVLPSRLNVLDCWRSSIFFFRIPHLPIPWSRGTKNHEWKKLYDTVKFHENLNSSNPNRKKTQNEEWKQYCWWFRNPANQLRLVVYPIIYKVLYIPGGCLGFRPSTVSQNIKFANASWNSCSNKKHVTMHTRPVLFAIFLHWRLTPKPTFNFCKMLFFF